MSNVQVHHDNDSWSADVLRKAGIETVVEHIDRVLDNEDDEAGTFQLTPSTIEKKTNVPIAEYRFFGMSARSTSDMHNVVSSNAIGGIRSAALVTNGESTGIKAGWRRRVGASPR
jgi:hypothetical protein